MGMPKYDDLSVEDMRAIFMYVRHGAPGRSLRQQVEQPGVASDRSAGLSLNWSTHP
jgi:hypothetical protein